MAKKKEKIIELLTKEQEKEFQNMINEMLEIAADVVKEYDDLDLDDLHALSGSITQINENSPFLDGIFKGDSWKRVVKNMNESENKSENDDTK